MAEAVAFLDEPGRDQFFCIYSEGTPSETLIRLHVDSTSKTCMFTRGETSLGGVLNLDDVKFIIACMKSGNWRKFARPSQKDGVLHCYVWRRFATGQPYFTFAFTRGESRDEFGSGSIPLERVEAVAQQLQDMLNYCLKADLSFQERVMNERRTSSHSN